MTLKQDFLAEILTFLAARKMCASTFGMEAMGDPNFVADLEFGRCARLDTIEKVRAFIAAYPLKMIEANQPERLENASG